MECFLASKQLNKSVENSSIDERTGRFVSFVKHFRHQCVEQTNLTNKRVGIESSEIQMNSVLLSFLL